MKMLWSELLDGITCLHNGVQMQQRAAFDIYFPFFIQTPPRVITLDEHHFPSADDFLSHTEPLEEEMTATVIKTTPHFHPEQGIVR